MPYGSSDPCTCFECQAAFPHCKKLSEHLKKAHGMSSIDYCVRHMYASVKPTCPKCGGAPRFVSLSKGFKRYCTDHAVLAASEGGKRGGTKKKTWNKGLTKATDERMLAQSVRQTGEGNHFFGKHHTEDAKQRNAAAHRSDASDIVARVSAAGAELLTDLASYRDQNDMLDIMCLTCHTHDRVSLFNLKRCWRCKACFPLASRPQLEVASFVRSLGFEDIEVSTRRVVPPLEIDVWVPSMRLAIEYHGLYWHSGGKDGVFDKKRHRQKYEACSTAGIKLVQFFSDEWIHRGNICRSMLTNALRKNSTKLRAHDCLLVDLSPSASREFQEANHIQGHARARHHVGLVHKRSGLVGLITTRTPVQKRYGHVAELARMCFALGTTVYGGAPKLINEAKRRARADGFDGLLSYAELRYGEGNVYALNGFSVAGEAPTNYWYTDGDRRFDRFIFRAQPGKTEKQVAEEAGVRAVWGAGNRAYLYRF